MSVEQGISITSAEVVGNFVELLFCGVFLVTCCSCASILLLDGTGPEERWLRPSEIHWIMVGVASGLFFICTFNVATGCTLIMHTFESQDSTAALFKITWMDIARSMDQVFAILLGDFVLVYRCWIVCAHRRLVIIPSLVLYLGSITIAIRLLEFEAGLSTSNLEMKLSPKAPQVHVWWTTFFAITAVQNTLTTGILVWRIWRVERRSERFSEYEIEARALRKVIRVILESGTAYTLMVYTCTVLSVTDSNALYPVYGMTLQAAGIVFNVIIFRSSAKRNRQLSEIEQSIPGSIRFTHGRTTVVQTIDYPPTGGGGNGSPQVFCGTQITDKPPSAFEDFS